LDFKQSGGFSVMNTCTLIDFMQALKPWLNDNYIHQASISAEGRFTLRFVDGGCKTYQIDGCTSEQMEHTLALLKENGVQVTR
jgi:hypothetical protein